MAGGGENSMTVWPSCPQACIFPGTALHRQGRSPPGSAGRPCRARCRSACVPAPAVSVPTTPVPPILRCTREHSPSRRAGGATRSRSHAPRSRAPGGRAGCRRSATKSFSSATISEISTADPAFGPGCGRTPNFLNTFVVQPAPRPALLARHVPVMAPFVCGDHASASSVWRRPTARLRLPVRRAPRPRLGPRRGLGQKKRAVTTAAQVWRKRPKGERQRR